jgi:hypothetical protein
MSILEGVRIREASIVHELNCNVGALWVLTLTFYSLHENLMLFRHHIHGVWAAPSGWEVYHYRTNQFNYTPS